jgi:hypothetical protein
MLGQEERQNEWQVVVEGRAWTCHGLLPWDAGRVRARRWSSGHGRVRLMLPPVT